MAHPNEFTRTPGRLPGERPTGFRWVVFALACSTSWMLYLHRYTFALIKPELEKEWGLSNIQLGSLDTAFAIFYSACQFPGGIIADLIGSHLFLGAIILAWSISLGLHGVVHGLTQLWYVRAAFGLSQAGTYASMTPITRNWFPIASRTSMQGWIGVFFGRIGGVSANLIFATVLMGMLSLDWRTSLYLFAGAGVLLGIVFLALFRDSPRRHPLVNEAEADLIEGVSPRHESEEVEVQAGDKPGDARHDEPPKRLTVRQLFGRMSFRSILNLLSVNLQSLLSTAADGIYSMWIPLFLFQVHDLEYKEMGLYSSLPLLGGALGGAVGGFLNDLLIRRTGNRRWSRSAVGLAGKGMAAILIVAALWCYDNPYLFCSLLFFVKFFGDWSLTTLWGVVTDIGGRTSATVFAFNNSLASLAGIVSPIIYGFVSQYYGWPAVFVIAGVIYAGCALSWLLIDCTIPVLAEEETSSNAAKEPS